MKRKYSIILTLIIIAIGIGIGIISYPYFRKAKSYHEHSIMLDNVNKAFEEMVVFCEENQEVIEAYSSRYLSSRSPDMSYEEIEKLEKQIREDMDCVWLFEKISFRFTGESKRGETEGIILYEYESFYYVDYQDIPDPRTIDIFYLKEEIPQQEFEDMHFFDDPNILYDIKKINDHLYVCERGRMCL